MPRKPKTDERIEALIAHFEGERDFHRLALQELDKTRIYHQVQFDTALAALGVLRKPIPAQSEPKPAEVKPTKRVKKVKDDGDELAELRGKVEAEFNRLSEAGVNTGENLRINEALDILHINLWSLAECRTALAAMRDMRPGKEAAA